MKRWQKALYALAVLVALSGGVGAAVTWKSIFFLQASSSHTAALNGETGPGQDFWVLTGGHPMAHANGIDWQLDGFSYSAQAWGADPTDTNDSTTAIQNAINAASTSAAGGGVVVLLPGTYKISSAAGIVLKSGVSLVGQSSGATVLDCKYTAVNCINIAAGPVANVHVQGLFVRGDYTNATANSVNQRGLLILAQDGAGTGGLWSSDFTDVQVFGFTGEGIWLRGNLNDTNHPNQFLNFFNVTVDAQPGSTRNTSCYVTPEAIDPTHANGTGPCYLIRMTGQIDQVTFINGQVNGPSTSTKSGTNIYIGYEVTSAETSQPNLVQFTAGFSCQAAVQCALVQFAHDVSFDHCWLEQLKYGVNFRWTLGSRFNYNHVANATTDGASGGYAAQSDGATMILTAIGNNISGTVDNDFKGINNGNVSTRDNFSVTNGSAKPSGNTVQVAPSGTLTAYNYRTLLVNGGSSITTINSQLGTGEDMTLYAFGGSFTLASGGNISAGQLTLPLTVPQNGVIRLVRYDLGATWTIESAFYGGTVPQATTFSSTATFGGGVTASGSTANDFSGSAGAFKTSTGANTFGGSSNTFTNAVTAPQVVGSGTPAVAVGVAAQLGTSPSASISGSDLSGNITVTTGTTPSAFTASTATIIATITFANTQPTNPPKIIVEPTNNNAILVQIASPTITCWARQADITTTTWKLECISTSTPTFSASTAYIFSYHVLN